MNANNEMPEQIWARIMRKVNFAKDVTSPFVATPCWNWIGAKYPTGYGFIKIGKQSRKVHREVFKVVMMMDLSENDFVCHKCDNPSCVNPEHLF